MSKAKDNASLSSRLRSGVGALVTSDSDSLETIAPGTNGQVLTVDSTNPNGIKWATPGVSGLSGAQITDLTDGGESTLHYHASDRALGNATGTLAVANGGTASTSAQVAINTLTAVAGAAEGEVLTRVSGNAAWAAVSGSGIGDVTGPASAVDSQIAAFDGTSGKLIKDGGILTTAIATKTGTETLTNKTMSTGSTWSGNAVSAVSGGTAQTSWTKGDILFASATNTLAKLPVGASGQTLAVSGAGIPAWTSPATGTEVTTLTSAAIQTAINAASAAGGGLVKLIAGTYVISSTLILPSRVSLVGSGIDVTILSLANGVNASVVTTTDTNTLIGSTTSAEGAQYWGISDLSIDGNKANNTAGHGIYTYSRAFKIERVKVTYCKERGVYSKWGYSTAAWADSDALAYDPFMEASVDGLYVGYCDKEGVYWDGPHDSKLSNVYVALCSHTTANAYDGIYVGPGAGGTIWTNCHPWGDNHRYNWNISCGWTTFTGCVSDDGYTAGVYVNADHVTWTGGFIFGAVFGTPDADDLAYRGIVLSSNAWHPYITSQCVNCSQGAIDFTSAPNGAGTIILSGSVDASLNSGTTTYGYKGTPPSNLNVQINIYDPDVNDSYYSLSSGSGVFGDTVTVNQADPVWPISTQPANSPVKIGYGTLSTPKVLSDTSSGTGIYQQSWVQTAFPNASAQSTGSAWFETILTGGTGGCTSLYAHAKIQNGTSPNGGVVGGHFIADARYAGSLSGLAIAGAWAEVETPITSSGGNFYPGMEINSYTNFTWSPVTQYAIDPFINGGASSVLGLIVQNFKKYAEQNAIGATAAFEQYQNTFGVALTCLNGYGRSFGFQTGFYASDCSQEAIRIRGGVYGYTDKYTKYGIKFEGTACSVAGIALGNNKFNWGASTGTVSTEGDMLYNATSNILYFNQGGSTKEMLCTGGVGTSGSYTADRKVSVNIGGTTYYLLASTTA